jgi:hypothetical protein
MIWTIVICWLLVSVVASIGLCLVRSYATRIHASPRPNSRQLGG